MPQKQGVSNFQVYFATSTLIPALVDFVDVEDVVKSIHKVVHPEEYVERKSNVVHTTIDWSKYPPSAFKRCSQDVHTVKDEGEDGEVQDNEDNEDEEQKHYTGKHKVLAK